MKNTIFRLVLVLVAIAAVGGAAYHVFTLDQRSAALREADRAFAEGALRLQATLADLHAAQAGYLATGQDTAYWIGKASQLRQQADAELTRLAATGPGTEAEADLATVAESLASFGRFDTRVRELLRGEQPLTASSLIFTDAARVLASASAALGATRGTRASKTGLALAGLRQQELFAAAGASGVVVIVFLLLLPVRRASAASRDEEAEGTRDAGASLDGWRGEPTAMPAASGRAGLGLDFDLGPRTPSMRRPAEAEEPEAMAVRRGVSIGSPAADAVPLGLDNFDAPRIAPADTPPSAWTIDLGAAARLCTDLARVNDTSELQGLLARAAVLLDATGIVVWMGGADGEVLWPAFSHGYSPQTLSKMQALPRGGSTPVSVAFRNGLMEVVPAGERTSGALVAPILAAAGCVGVMAAEIRHGAETREAEQALAGILAAQLATLVAGDPGARS